MLKNSLTALCLALLLFSCGRSGGDATAPKRDAFPRVEPYDTAYTRVSDGVFTFKVNRQCAVSSTAQGWTNVDFSRYGARLHLTALEFDSDEAFGNALDRRLQRMALNIGADTASDTMMVNDKGIEALKMTCTEGIPTPIQFVAVDKPRRLLSGTVVMDGKTKPADSVAYIVERISAQVDTLLSSLSCVDGE